MIMQTNMQIIGKEKKTIKSGKSSFRDSGRQKTYNAEFLIREYKFADGYIQVIKRTVQNSELERDSKILQQDCKI